MKGRGYASEAVSAVLALHDRTFPGEVVSCSIHADNAASLRVAEKARFAERTRTTYNDEPTVILDLEGFDVTEVRAGTRGRKGRYRIWN